MKKKILCNSITHATIVYISDIAGPWQNTQFYLPSPSGGDALQFAEYVYLQWSTMAESGERSELNYFAEILRWNLQLKYAKIWPAFYLFVVGRPTMVERNTATQLKKD